MRFIQTDRLSPVINYGDLPWEDDYFHLNPEEISKDFLLKGNYDIDTLWWEKQDDRCRNGYTVENCIDYGGDVYVDEVDVFWNDSLINDRYVKSIDYNIPPNSCYIPMYDLLIKDRAITISGRHYFYLNFGKIYALDNSKNKKDITNEYSDIKGLNSPIFTDVDWGFFTRINNMFRFKKDTSEAKTRQLGYSQKSGIGLLSYNFTFIPYSVSIVAGGMSDDADNTFAICREFTENIRNTQFYKIKKRGGDRDNFIQSLNSGSKVYSISCKDNAQALSRLTAYFTILEECYGKNTKILMANGKFKNVQDIKYGDYVKGNNNLPMKVVHTTKGFGNLYLIEQQKGQSYIVNEKHRLCLEQHMNSLDYKDDGFKYYTVSELEQLIKSKRKCTYGTKSSGVEYRFKKVPIDPYYLGLWLGDGYRKDMVITTESDVIENSIREYASSIMLNCKTTYYKNSKNRKVGLSDGNGYCRKFLKKLKLYDNKHIPESYLINSMNVRLQLLAGLIDTDGNLAQSGSYSYAYEITQKSKRLINGISELCKSCGFYVVIREKIVSNKLYYRLRLSGNIDKIPVKLEYKKPPKDYKHTSNPLNTQIKTKSIGLGDFYGFTLEAYKDEDRIVIINDYTLSMNCGKWKKGLVQEVMQFNKAAQKAQGKKTGFNVFIGTGGDMELGAADLEDMHYHPVENGLLSYRNKWEKDDSCIEGLSGHFTPGWQFKIIDSDGNSLKEPSVKFLEDELALIPKRDTKKRYIFTTQHALYAADAFLISSGGFFGEEIVRMVNERKAYIMTHTAEQKEKVGRLEWLDPKNPFAGCKFVNDEKGSIHIFEEPELDRSGKPYVNLYKAGTDSYDQDESMTSVSKGDIRILKGFLNANTTYHKFVAKCTDRPLTSEGGKDVWYENTAKLCIYYGANNLIEHSKLIILEWYVNHNFEVLLKERPGLTLAKMIKRSKDVNEYGITTATKVHWLTKYRKFLEVQGNIDNMDDVEQLTSIAKFRLDPKYNCDTTIASSLAVVCLEDDIEMEVRENNKEVEKERLMRFKRVGDKIIQVFE